MIQKIDVKKTIALPIEIHQKAGDLAKQVGLKQYEFITAAINLAEADDKFLQAIVETHAKKFGVNKLDDEVRKKLESLSAEDLEELLKHLKK